MLREIRTSYVALITAECYSTHLSKSAGTKLQCFANNHLHYHVQININYIKTSIYKHNPFFSENELKHSWIIISQSF